MLARGAAAPVRYACVMAARIFFKMCVAASVFAVACGPDAHETASAEGGSTSVASATGADEPTAGHDDGAPVRVIYQAVRPGSLDGGTIRAVDVEGGAVGAPVTVIGGGDEGLTDWWVAPDEQTMVVVDRRPAGDRLWSVDLTTRQATPYTFGAPVAAIGLGGIAEDGRFTVLAGPDGGSALRLCSFDSVDCSGPALSAPAPAGPSCCEEAAAPGLARFVYAADLDGAGGTDLMLVDVAQPGEATMLASYTNPWARVSGLEFSADGSTLYWAVDASEKNDLEFYAVDLAQDPSLPPVRLDPPMDARVLGGLAPGLGALVLWSGPELRGDLFRVAIDGVTAGAPELLNAGGPGRVGQRIAWSPDGARVLFLSDHAVPGRDEVYVVDIAGAAPVPVKVNAPIAQGTVIRAEFTPDPTRIVYTVEVDADGATDLYWASVAAPGDATLLSAPGGAWSWSVHGWSPDGSRLVYSGVEAGEGTEKLLMIDFAGGAPSSPIELAALTPAMDIRGGTSFTSDGRRVFFYATRPAGESVVFELFTVGIGGDGVPTGAVQVSAPGEFVLRHRLLAPA